MSNTQAELLRQLSLDRSHAPNRRGSKRRWPMILAALAIFAAIASLARMPKSQSKAGANPVTLATARAADTGAVTPTAVLDASGYVVARRAATVSAKVTGKVVDVLIEEGQKVQEGQVLAHLDDTNARAQLDLTAAQADQARAQAAELKVSLQNAERDLGRQRDIFEKKLVSQAAVDNADTVVNQFKARLVSVQKGVAVAEQQRVVARRAVEDTVIRAPFTGVVTVKNAQPGEMISPLSGGGSSFTRSGIGTLVDMNSQEIEVDVAESFIGKVVNGAPVKIKLNAYPDAELKGSVIAIVPTADRAKATVKVRVAFVREPDGSIDARILPEMGARVSFLNTEAVQTSQSAPKTGVYVPAAAVQGEGSASFVWLVSDGKARKLPVTLGEKSGEEWHIPAGLAAGSRLAIGSALNEGDKIPDQP